MRNDCVIRKWTAGSQTGFALAVSLLLLLILSVLGVGLLVGTRGSTTASHSFYSQTRAVEAAEAGLEHSRQSIRAALVTQTLTDLLEDARDGGTLVDSSSLSNFLGSNGLVNQTANAPILGPTTRDHASYQVFLTNDAADGTTNPVDTNDQVTVTSFGSGSEEVGFAALQVMLRMALGELSRPAGFLSLPGPTVVFDGLSSNASRVNGEDQAGSGACIPSVAVTSAVARQVVVNEMLGPPNRANRYRSCDPNGGPMLTGPTTVENVIVNDPLAPTNPYEPLAPNAPYFGAGDPNLVSVPYLNDLVSRIRKQADFTSQGDSGFTLGSTADPKIVVIDGNYSLSGSGAGILVVTGKLIMQGNASYDGFILAVGRGEVQVSGGGSGGILGSMLVANTDQPWDPQGRYVGVPTYEVSGGGGGNQSFDFSKAVIDEVRQNLPLERVSYSRLR